MRSRTPRLLLIVAIIACAALVTPYLGLDIDKSRLPVGGPAHYAVLVVHIFTAAVALVAGPLQFFPGLRMRTRFHRGLGRVYLLAGVLPSAVTAIPVALWSGRPVTQIGLTTASLLWLVTAVLAYRAALRRDLAGHRDWMLRNYALTFLAVTARVLVPLMLLGQLPFRRVDVASITEDLVPLGQTLGWILDLAVIEAVIRHRRRAPLPSGARR